MPTHRLPRNSAPHRHAAIALYRALLTQCRALSSIQHGQREAIQNIIRNRFKQARHEQSLHRLSRNFHAGYTAIDRLDAAVAGVEECRSYILSLLARAPSQVKQPPRTILPKHLQREAEKRRKAIAALNDPPPEKLDIFDRPLPKEKLSGRRHVPVLYNAQKIPVLRFTKPQPQALSGYIAHRARKTQRRHDVRHRLEEELEMARWEDEWDSITAPYLREAEAEKREGKASRQAKQQSDDGITETASVDPRSRAGWRDDAGPAWTHALRFAKRELSERMNADKERNGEMARRMQGVVDRERALYEQEREEARRRRREMLTERVRVRRREERSAAKGKGEKKDRSPGGVEGLAGGTG